MGNTGLFAGATDTNLGTIALLGGLGGGLGGGYGQHGGYYPAPAYGAHPAPAQGGRKRRGIGDEEEEISETIDVRKRRSGTSVDCSKNSDDPACKKRKRRETGCNGEVECETNRRRREAETEACAICRLNSDSMMCEECDE